MYPPRNFDIGWPDLVYGMVACGRDGDADRWAATVERRFAEGGVRATEDVRATGGMWATGGADRPPAGEGDPTPSPCLATLSVRSALDLALTAASLPRGSEVLMSAVTIPDMWRIVTEHGLVPVPVDLNADTLLPTAERWAAAATERTRAVVVAHLFGTRSPLGPLAELAARRGWLLIEDCAQAYSGPGFRGSPEADVSLFSFGPLKTATALGGAVAVVRNPGLLAAMRALHREWPVQTRDAQARRVAKYALLALLTTRPVYTGLVAAAGALGHDHASGLQNTVGAFAGADLIPAIRQRPGPALLDLLDRRLRAPDTARAVAERAEVARRLVTRLPDPSLVYGAAAPVHTYWLCAVPTPDPDATTARLRSAGFDAARPTSLGAVPAPPDRPQGARTAAHLIRHAVCLPLRPNMSDRTLDRMAALLDPEDWGTTR
ncbi:DegT/DnrJ/EryC1/StrS family aminotransferase [Streptomyces albofaciens]|uniref:DegT/DnrJ/EryC1/StrS family aminotransferase n=1 Tax=Streptomyces albofaciens TaxID=66866 RepID=UPI00142EC485|nr:DegT/DnrJ/EryC1/StrS family aminotransferase [Streptomyces albofaciens]